MFTLTFFIENMSTTSIVLNVFLGFGAVEKSHAMDTQSEDSSQDDLQPTSTELSKMSVPILH